VVATRRREAGRGYGFVQTFDRGTFCGVRAKMEDLCRAAFGESLDAEVRGMWLGQLRPRGLDAIGELRLGSLVREADHQRPSPA
jgi:hypothetical protein